MVAVVAFIIVTYISDYSSTSLKIHHTDIERNLFEKFFFIRHKNPSQRMNSVRGSLFRLTKNPLAAFRAMNI